MIILDDVLDHLNVESVIRYYLRFLPPRGSESILDIGAGRTAPYSGILKNRCKVYAALDIREGPKVDYVADVCDLSIFQDGVWEWSWCVEMLEHIPSPLKLKAVKEIMRVCLNCVFTYPRPIHPSFASDPGHTEVRINWSVEFWKTHHILDRSTRTGRVIKILRRRTGR